MMDADAPTITKAEMAAARKQVLLEKERKQKEFIEKCTIADVLVDAENPKSLKGSTDTTPLQSIKGACPNLLSANALRQFMIINKLLNYRNKSKSEMCSMIVQRKKNENLDQIMYGEDFGGEKDGDDDSEDDTEEVTGGDGNSKKPKRLSKGSKPKEITKDGSLYRLIMTYFLQELRPYVSQLGTNPLAVELGTAGFLHEPIYNKLASVYNDSAQEFLKTFVVNHDIYVTSGIQKEAPATFDQLSALSVSQGMDFINKHYRQAKRNQVLSGNHKPFDAYCTNRPYLLLYHNSLLECGDQVLSSLAVPKLPDDVKRSSLSNKKPVKKPSVPTTAEKQKRSSAVLDGLLEVSNCQEVSSAHYLHVLTILLPFFLI
jgi:hypothetical protein